MKFLFYDVETAHQKRTGSICAVGWQLVENMSLIDRGYTLIDPMTPFSSYNTRVHGITAQDVSGAPTFIEYWHSTLSSLMHDCVVVAHGAEFDIRATEQALFDASIVGVSIDYFDFLPVAKHLIPNQENYKLDTLAKWAGISFCHHCASDDSCALFEIAKVLCEKLGYSSLEELFIRSHSVLQNSADNSFTPHKEEKLPEAKAKTFREYKKYSGPVEPIDDALCHCIFCVTGNVGDYGRDQVEKMIREHGGEFKTGVSKKTNVLVVGPYGDDYPIGYMSGKHKDALALVESGYPIHIITASQFLELMQNPAEHPIIKAIRQQEVETLKTEKASPYPQSPQEIERLWKEFVQEPTDDPDAFSYSQTQNGFSFFVYGQKSFELIRSKKGMTLRIDSELMQLLYPEREDIVENKFYPLPVDQLSSFPNVLKTHKHYTFRHLITEKFACCHEFIKCSDARACLHPYDRTYNGCYYRTNLEKGLIFYGKNRNADQNGLFSEQNL